MLEPGAGESRSSERMNRAVEGQLPFCPGPTSAAPKGKQYILDGPRSGNKNQTNNAVRIFLKVQ